MKVWEPYVPPGYRYTPLQGIDSFVGQITNDTITFNFDYGLYGGSVPKTNRDIKSIIQGPRRHCEKANSLLNEKDDIDLCNDDFEVVQVTVDSLKWDGSGFYSIDMQLHDTYIVLNDDLGIPHQYLHDAATLEVQPKEFENYTTHMFLPKDTRQNRAGLKVHEDDGRTHLNYYTCDYNVETREEIVDVLTSLRENYLSTFDAESE